MVNFINTFSNTSLSRIIEFKKSKENLEKVDVYLTEKLVKFSINLI